MVKEGSCVCAKLLSCPVLDAPSFVCGLKVSFKRMPSGVLDELRALFTFGLPVLPVLVALLMSSALERGLLHVFRR